MERISGSVWNAQTGSAGEKCGETEKQVCSSDIAAFHIQRDILFSRNGTARVEGTQEGCLWEIYVRESEMQGDVQLTRVALYASVRS